MKNKKNVDDNHSFGAAAFEISGERAKELMDAIVDPISNGDPVLDQFNGKGWDVLYREFVKPMAKTPGEGLYCAYVFGATKIQRDIKHVVNQKIKAGLMMAALAGAAKGQDLAGFAGLAKLFGVDEEE